MLDPKHPLAELLRRDNRYDFDAYVFVFDALRFGQEQLGLGAKEACPDDAPGEPDPADEDALGSEEHDDDEVERHVTGQELCRAIQRYAIDQYGMLARCVLDHWGVKTTGDFGEIVFNLIDIGQMRKTDNDRREDFDDVFDFGEAFDEQTVFAADAVESEEDETDA